jgi:hypothetical protein
VLDTVLQQLRLPSDKLKKIRDAINKWDRRQKATLKELQSLIGLLQFCSRAIWPARAYLQNMVNLTRGVTHPNHYIRLTNAFHKDIDMWRVFLNDDWNGVSLFINDEWRDSDAMQFYTDSSGWGCAGVLGTRWFYMPWPNHYTLNGQEGISIEFLEMWPIVASAHIFGHSMTRQKIMFNCDNQSVVHILNKRSSKIPRIMGLVRSLVAASMKHNFLLRARHLSSKANLECDLLSRNRVAAFLQIRPDADRAPCMIPPQLTRL